VGVLYTELTLTGKSSAVFSLGEEAEWTFLPEDKHCAFRTVMRGSPLNWYFLINQMLAFLTDNV